ncbi:hypothetical protein EROM_070680 [Encephalitozoon romaleae SJ-2008]|uniref:Uncharacterized protein n=1 Tax=Encephalitozoon romaleae (strain SJ-2008) TaxID=1178016 RepID=I7ANH1_ENCRO|nr:hypothetical protein EROM_070680 [Encephalitozoon romaleae SJ-2008]AFN83319.1 hypothetical protein EROM_070680 [Encephalitozoon romaleae SJ-2008]
MEIEYKSMACSIIVTLGLMVGLSMESFVCKTANCAFFLSSTLFISIVLTLFNLAHMMRAKTRITPISAYTGSISALIDIMIIFVYTKILHMNSLFFCLAYLMYQVTASILSCFIPFGSSAFMICICVIFLSPLFDLWFVEEHGFSRSQVPDFMRYYITNRSMNIIFFIPIVGIRVLFGEFFGRIGDRESSNFFSFLAMAVAGTMLAFVDTSTFKEELHKMDSVFIPFIVSNSILAGSLIIAKLNRSINLPSVYSPMSVLFIIISSLFCSSAMPWVWKKTILEHSLNSPYLFYLFTFSLFILYIVIVRKDSIVSRPTRDGFAPRMTWWLWG